MKLTCLPEKLNEGLAAVGRVVAARSTLPVLGNVLLRTDGDRLMLAATNLELTVVCRVAARVEEEGAITLPSRLLQDYVGLLTAGEPLHLAVNGTKAALRCGAFKANLSGIDAEEFPAIPSTDGMSGFSLPSAMLKRAIDQTAFAAAPDDSRPVLAGVLLESRDGRLTLAAADGFRLAIRRLDLEEDAPDLSVIVPAKALQEAARGLTTDEDCVAEVLVTADRSQIAVRCRDRLVISRLIEGQFPDFNRIIPRETKTRVTLQTADFLRATKAAQVFARDNSMIVRLNLVPAEGGDEALGKVTVAATSAEIGDNTGDVDASVEGDAMQVAFNGRYLRDALEAIDTSQAMLEATGPASPGLIRPADAALDYLLVVMPMSVNGGAR